MTPPNSSTTPIILVLQSGTFFFVQTQKKNVPAFYRNMRGRRIKVEGRGHMFLAEGGGGSNPPGVIKFGHFYSIFSSNFNVHFFMQICRWSDFFSDFCPLIFRNFANFSSNFCQKITIFITRKVTNFRPKPSGKSGCLKNVNFCSFFDEIFDHFLSNFCQFLSNFVNFCHFRKNPLSMETPKIDNFDIFWKFCQILMIFVAKNSIFGGSAKSRFLDNPSPFSLFLGLKFRPHFYHHFITFLSHFYQFLPFFVNFC